MAVRLQKILAEAGVASRRASETLIQAGRVRVNGVVVRQLGTKVDPAQDTVMVDGRPVRPRRKLYVALHKPTGCICSRRDEAGRPTVFDFLPAEWRNLYPVGRLDYNSEGLLFLTNDGDFALRLTHPRYGVRKRYRVVTEGRLDAERLSPLTRGVWQGGERLRATRVRLVSTSNTRSVVELELAEGRNREVRRLFEALGLSVLRLERTQIGPITLGQLRPGRWRTLTEAEIRSLLKPL